jgi:hypothetical protein
MEKRLVEVHEPYQMLGLVEDDLKLAMGIDVDGVSPRKTMFGFANHHWKSWRTPQGLEVLVSEDFRVTTDEKGDTLIYPEGDTSAPPSGRLPQDGYFFDTIVRQEPIEEERLNVGSGLLKRAHLSPLEANWTCHSTGCDCPWKLTMSEFPLSS